MCGIIGILGDSQPASERLLEALRRLEYRGYDSAGVATLEPGQGIQRRRAAGKIRNLEARLREAPLSGVDGVGHTRWATHGAPTEANAHPHQAGRAAIVHNGIIENFRSLRQALAAKGRRFESDTDSEVIAHLLDMELAAGGDPLAAMARTAAQLQGAYAIAALVDGERRFLLGARHGSPLAFGAAGPERFLGSDAIALSPFIQAVTYLEDGDCCLLEEAGVRVIDAQGRPVERASTPITGLSGVADKGPHRHFMQKEIYEQVETLPRVLGAYLDAGARRAVLPGFAALNPAQAARLHLIACGTSVYACQVGRLWFESVARLPASAEIASEFRYREPLLGPHDLALFVSQSGETADTLAALKHCKTAGAPTIGVINAEMSSMAREAAALWRTLCGPEIGVASTKAFTAQLTVLACASLEAARARGVLSPDEEAVHVDALLSLPRLMLEALQAEETITRLAQEIARARTVLYLGRGPSFPLALEGALKLKEVSYIHAEGFAAGELKHGPIALIDEETVVVALAPSDRWFDKTVSNMEEAAARGAKVVLVSDEAGLARAGSHAWASIPMPAAPGLTAPIIAAAPLQLLAYHVAVHKGTDVDQPRNLAKSVTVE
jgi:glucosamine--fructose-6-phosphate aminotransferase (isomerizing)